MQTFSPKKEKGTVVMHMIKNLLYEQNNNTNQDFQRLF
jgi:hypothetical protein